MMDLEAIVQRVVAADDAVKSARNPLERSYAEDACSDEVRRHWMPVERAREILALVTRLRAAESALPSAADVYAIEEARAAIESSCDVYCDEIDAWLSRVGEARAVQHGSAALRAAEARTAWQPIETAPEYTRCLLRDSQRNVRIGWRKRGAIGWQCDGGGGLFYPEAWMPLPAAPEAP